MPVNEAPTINGVKHSSAECSLTLSMYGGGKPFRTADFVDFSLGEKLEPADVVVLGGVKVGTTEGVYTGTGSFTLLLAAHVELLAMMAKVAKAKRVKLGAVAFGIQGSFRPTLADPLVRFAALGVRLTERTLEGAPDAGAIQVTSPLNLGRLRINGLSLGEIPR